MASGGNGEPKPFTADELNNFNGDWSLKCDLQLLSSLKLLSGSLVKDAGTLLERVQGLAHDTEDKSVKVSNVINDLQMMASHQFIENRVYDEESEDTPIQQQPQETREVDMVSRISQSLRQGMQLLDKEFKDAPSIVSHSQSPDSDDDQDNLRQEVYDIMNRSRFASKKLPPIIGSQDFTRHNFHSLFSDGSLQFADDSDGPVVYSFKQEDQTVVEPSFEAYEGQEDDDYDDRQEPQDIVISDSDDSDDFFKPRPSIVSRKSLPVVAAPPPPPLFNSPDAEGDLFDDGEDMFKSSVPKIPVEATQPLSFKDELNRRLANGPVTADKKQVADTLDIPAPTVIKDATHEVKSVPEVKPEVVPEAVKTPMVQASHHHVTVQAQAKQAIVSNNVTQDSKANKPKFDFFSDDDDTDDNFDIFAKKPSITKQVLSKVKPAKILDSSSDDEDFKTTKVPVSTPPRKVSEATEGKRQHPHQHQRPEEEAKHRQSLPPEKETPSFMPFKDKVLENQTQGTGKSQPTSTLFQDDSDSDEDLFSQRITKKRNESLISSNRASLSGITSNNNQDTVVNSLKESQEDSTAASPSKNNSPIVPEEVSLRRKSPSSASESQETEKMDRKSIASRLENTIFGSGPKKKPVGGISIFKDVNPPKPQTDSKTVTDEKNEKVTEEVKEAASNNTLAVAAEVPTTSKDVNRMSTSSVKSVVESQSVSSKQLPDSSPKSTPQKVDESPQLLQNNSLKTRAKIPVQRKRPTRAGRLNQSTSSPVITSPDSNVNDDSIGKESINEVKETPSKSIISEAKEDHEDLFSSPRSSNELNTERRRSDVFDDKPPKVTQQRSQQQPKSVDKSVKDPKTKVTKSSIFSDSEDDEDIFSKVSQKQNKSGLSKAGKTLFGDSSEDEIQAVSKKEVPSTQGKKEQSPAKKIDEKKKEIKKENPKTMPTVKKDSSSKKLFDDDSDDDDLFAPKSKS